MAEQGGWLRRAGAASWAFIGVVIAVALVVAGLLQITLVLVAVFLALIIASVLDPVVDRLDRVMPRPLAVALSLIGSGLVLVSLLGFIVWSVADQWDDLTASVGDGLDQITGTINSSPLPVRISDGDVDRWVQDGLTWLQENSGAIAGGVVAQAGGVFEGFTAIALALFVSLFFLATGAQMWRWFLDRLPARHRGRTHEAAGVAWHTFSGYARGLAVIALINGTLAYLLLLVVGIPLAAPLALLVLLGTFIPLVGAPAAMVIAAVVALATGGLVPAIIVLIGIALIGQLEGHVLQPLIMGRAVKLHPVAVALGVAGGTVLAGLPGAVVSIPLLACAWAVWNVVHEDDPPIRGALPDVRPERSR